MHVDTLIRSIPAPSIVSPFTALRCVMDVLEFRTPLSTLFTIFLGFLVGP